MSQFSPGELIYLGFEQFGVGTRARSQDGGDLADHEVSNFSVPAGMELFLIGEMSKRKSLPGCEGGKSLLNYLTRGEIRQAFNDEVVCAVF